MPSKTKTVAKTSPRAAKAVQEVKPDPKSLEIQVKTQEGENGEAIDADELEDAAPVAGGGEAAAALAAVTNPTEMSASFKNFRHHPDMENFYRFIYENDLRYEALTIIDEMQLQKRTRKMVRGAKTQAH